MPHHATTPQIKIRHGELGPLASLIAKAARAIRAPFHAKNTQSYMFGDSHPPFQMPPMSQAIDSSNFKQLRSLLLLGTPSHGGIYDSPHYLWTPPLAFAAQNPRHPQMLAMMLDAGAPADLRFKRPAGVERGLLTWALSHGAWENAFLLMERMRDPLKPDSDGLSPLRAAAVYVGKTSVLSPTEYMHFFFQFCQRLAALGADLNDCGAPAQPRSSRGMGAGDTPLLATRGIPQPMRMLLDLGADPLKANANGDTPLMAAARGAMGHADASTLLALLAMDNVQQQAASTDIFGMDALAHLCRNKAKAVLSQSQAGDIALACQKLLAAGASPAKALEVAASLEEPWMRVVLASLEHALLDGELPARQSLAASKPKRL